MIRVNMRSILLSSFARIILHGTNEEYDGKESTHTQRFTVP